MRFFLVLILMLLCMNILSQEPAALREEYDTLKNQYQQMLESGSANPQELMETSGLMEKTRNALEKLLGKEKTDNIEIQSKDKIDEIKDKAVDVAIDKATGWIFGNKNKDDKPESEKTWKEKIKDRIDEKIGNSSEKVLGELVRKALVDYVRDIDTDKIALLQKNHDLLYVIYDVLAEMGEFEVLYHLSDTLAKSYQKDTPEYEDALFYRDTSYLHMRIDAVQKKEKEFREKHPKSWKNAFNPFFYYDAADWKVQELSVKFKLRRNLKKNEKELKSLSDREKGRKAGIECRLKWLEKANNKLTGKNDSQYYYPVDFATTTRKLTPLIGDALVKNEIKTGNELIDKVIKIGGGILGGTSGNKGGTGIEEELKQIGVGLLGELLKEL